MDKQLIEMFNLAKEGKNEPRPISFKNMLISTMGGMIHIFNIRGDMTYGNYRIPPTEGEFEDFLEKMAKKIEELEENLQYICYSCKKTFDLPEFKKKDGAPICQKCATGSVEEKSAESKLEKSKEKPSQTKLDSAIKFLQANGYVVKKLVPSYRIAYLDNNGKAQISGEYYKSEEEFLGIMKDCTFLNMIEKLKKEEEFLEI